MSRQLECRKHISARKRAWGDDMVKVINLELYKQNTLNDLYMWIIVHYMYTHMY